VGQLRITSGLGTGSRHLEQGRASVAWSQQGGEVERHAMRKVLVVVWIMVAAIAFWLSTYLEFWNRLGDGFYLMRDPDAPTGEMILVHGPEPFTGGRNLLEGVTQCSRPVAGRVYGKSTSGCFVTTSEYPYVLMEDEGAWRERVAAEVGPQGVKLLTPSMLRSREFWIFQAGIAAFVGVGVVIWLLTRRTGTRSGATQNEGRAVMP
jgi:hypothetical protein